MTITRITLAAALLGGVALTGCTSTNDRNAMAEVAIRGGTVSWDADAGEFNYLYRYYPNEEVYQSVYNGTWHWRTGSGWTYGAALPADRTVAGHYHLLELPSKRPHTEHAQVAADYPSSDTLRARAEMYDLAYGRSAAEAASDDETRFATVPTDGGGRP